jgi:hypothetical protein
VLWCITITTCTSHEADKNRLHHMIPFSSDLANLLLTPDYGMC